MEIIKDLDRIDDFISNDMRTLFDGRIIQSSINQDIIFFLTSNNKEVKKIAVKIRNKSEEEQDSLKDIETNLLELKSLFL